MWKPMSRLVLCVTKTRRNNSHQRDSWNLSPYSIDLQRVYQWPSSLPCPTLEDESIIVVVDRFSKYDTFTTAPKDCIVDEAGWLFMKNVTDGQPKRVNILLQLYLRYFVSANQKDWAKLLDVAQFSYNLQTSESTGRNPFQLVTRQQPLTPTSLLESYGGRNLAAYRFVKGWHKKTNLARSYLEKAAKRMKNWANKKRRLARYQVGDLVIVKLLPLQCKAFRRFQKGLIQKYEGPFLITKKVGRYPTSLSFLHSLKSTQYSM
ncbi:hypothetical protein AMTRI_Chr13g89680 [Amborella trichopoda]